MNVVLTDPEPLIVTLEPGGGVFSALPSLEVTTSGGLRAVIGAWPESPTGDGFGWLALGWADETKYHRIRTAGIDNDHLLIELINPLTHTLYIKGALSVLAAGGVTFFRADSGTGRVGIGTTDPQYLLQLQGASADSNTGMFSLSTALTGRATQAELRMGVNNDVDTEEYSWIQSHGDRPLRINSLGNNVLFNITQGNVGIGTSAPVDMLQIGTQDPAGAGTYALHLRGDNASLNALPGIRSGGGGSLVLDSFRDLGATPAAHGRVYINSQDSTGDVIIGLGGGNVWIGYISILPTVDLPTDHKLHVVGNVMIEGFIEGAEQTAPAAPAANGGRLFYQDNGAGKTQLMVLFASGAAQQIAIQP